MPDSITSVADSEWTRSPAAGGRLVALLAEEERRFAESHPTSGRLFSEGRQNLFGGVPMPWMRTWPGGFPLFLDRAEGARLWDVDGHEYVDFCLGDSAAMAGHSSPPVAAAIAKRAATGITAMLPTADSIRVSRELARRFGLAIWQFTLSATEANRNAVRFARQITGRRKVLVFNYAYHGTVDEALVTLVDGRVAPKSWTLGPGYDPEVTSRVVEFNDVEALAGALAHEDVACVLAEPALTNIGIVLPQEGFHARLRELTRRHGSLLVIDETHTGCAGEGGASRLYGLEPDLLVAGKWIGGGMPVAALGMSAEVSERVNDSLPGPLRGPSGVGGTLAGNAMSLAAARATLESVLTPAAYESMVTVADRWVAGVRSVIDHARLPWHVVQLGCRAEYRFRATAPRHGGESAREIHQDLDRYLHLGCLNRGVLLTPFHSMALISPAHTIADADAHTDVFAELVQRLADGG